MTMYTDIYVRDGLDDNGNIPYTGAFASNSPDVIPQQQTTQPLSWFSSTWTQNPGLNINAGVNNYVYVRGKNLSTANSSGSVYLYCTPSTLLLNINYWSNNPISTGSSFNSTLVDLNNNPQIAANAICVGQSPFLLNVPVPQGFHYCLVTRVVTPSNPNPIPVAFSNTGAFVNWVVQNPNVAWRNITVVPPTSNAVSQSQYFANIDPTAENYWFLVQGTNFPNLSTVLIQGITAGCIFSTTGVFGAPGGDQNYATQQQVPASFSGVVNVTVTPPAGQSIPSGATLEIQYYRQTQGRDSDLLHKYAVSLGAKKIQPALLEASKVNGDVPTVVWLGSCGTVFK
jgi:hypothetical protein